MNIPISLPSKGLLGYSKDVIVPEWDFEAILNFSKVVETNLMQEYVLYLNKVCEGLPQGGAFNFTVEDIEYIMVMQRVNSLPNGKIYRFSFSHNNFSLVKERDKNNDIIERTINTCGYLNTVVVDLTEIKVKELEKGELGFEWDNTQYFFSPPSYRKKQEVINYFRDVLKRDVLSSEDITVTEYQNFILMCYLSSIKVVGQDKERVSDIENCSSLVKSFSLKFVSHVFEGIKNWFLNYGLDLNVSGVCENCKKEWQFRFPFLDGFFAIEV